MIVWPLRDLTACKSQEFKIAGQNIMATPDSWPESVETSIANVLRLAKAWQYVPNTEMLLERFLVVCLWIADCTRKIKKVRMRSNEYLFSTNSQMSLDFYSQSFDEHSLHRIYSRHPNIDVIWSRGDVLGCCAGFWLHKSHIPSELASWVFRQPFETEWEIGKGKAGSCCILQIWTIPSSLNSESIGLSVLVEKIERGEQPKYSNQTKETTGGGWWNGYLVESRLNVPGGNAVELKNLWVIKVWIAHAHFKTRWRGVVFFFTRQQLENIVNFIEHSLKRPLWRL